MKWSIESIPSLDGKIAVVTGANSGLGFETAKVLSSRGCTVLMACRDLGKGEQAIQSILSSCPEASLVLLELDLANQESIYACAGEILEHYKRLDLLYNNAGLMAIPFSRTVDGFETQIGVNHLGHFLFTALLFPLIRDTPQARIITISSVFHYLGRISIDDLIFENRRYNKWLAYAQSKLANLLFTFELQRRIKAAGYNTIAVAAHPGYAVTHLQTKGAEMEGRSIRRKIVSLMNALFGFSAYHGAHSQIRAGTDPSVKGGDYFGPGLLNWFFPNRPKKVWSTRRANNEEVASTLWELSEELLGFEFTV
ncbi:MAG: SDR family NAD(P)-dependent oxidoreductase [Candidatus Heimdallarchaeota archaeon]|nr:SDR family NAD(P)-dependent oxidoreductase [Candidatus Heimdallarchaeota archaeon]